MFKRIFLAVVIVFSLYVQFASISSYNFAFTPDQAITMLALRNIVNGHKLLLIGPETDFKGLYYGPLWYYMNIIPYMLSQGNPTFLVYLVIFCLVLSAVFLGKKVSWETGVLVLLSPAFLATTRYSLNANFAPTITLVFFALLLANSSSFGLGLFSGFILQIEAALGIFFLPFLLAYKLLRRKYRQAVLVMAGFVITLAPQAFFELRHNFGMTKILINNLLHPKSAEILPFFIRVSSHLNSFWIAFRTVWPYPVNIVYVLLWILALVLVISYYSHSRQARMLLTCVVFVVFCFGGYLFYSRALVGWYLYALYVPMFILFVQPAVILYKNSSRLGRAIGGTLLLTALISFVHQDLTVVHNQLTAASDDPSNLRNELAVVDKVYQLADNQGFSLYSFVPSIYDFQYQYLFWWYGYSRYGYRPAVISYLPNVPEYIDNNQRFMTQTKSVDSKSPTLLVADLTNSKAAENWLGNFSILCTGKTLQLPWRTVIQVKNVCDKMTDQ